jgi:hypothetical protein
MCALQTSSNLPLTAPQKPIQIFHLTEFYLMLNEEQHGMQEEFIHALKGALDIKYTLLSLPEL